MKSINDTVAEVKFKNGPTYNNLLNITIFEIKATQTISTGLFKEMDRFEEIAAPAEVYKTLIYGGAENEKRTKYNVLSRKNVSE